MLAGKPLRYLSGTGAAGAGRDDEVTEVAYSAAPVKRGISIAYCNLFDEHNTRRYGPYLRTSDTAAQYNEGQMANPNLSDYNIASALDCAAISHRVMEIPGAEVHGLGETAVPPVPPAIGNAVASLGYHPRRLPMTPERILASRDEDTA